MLQSTRPANVLFRSMTNPSRSHLLLIPSYNTGPKLVQTVREARQFWQPVWVVIDGSTDGSVKAMETLAKDDPHIKLFVLSRNQGKGAAVLHGLREAVKVGFTHVLTMDADGQHPANRIQEFMAVSRTNPNAMILGLPIFDASAPAVRVHGRKISNWWSNLETLWEGIGDSLFGFRVYPISPLRDIMEKGRWMRRFDFDPEAAVRLCWDGVRPINVSVPVKYLTPEEGGVSHFNYLRDNILLTWMYTRLFIGFLLRLPRLVFVRWRHGSKAA
jgi:glycosyltransferase involved in cell wall biosynthesis